MVEDETIAPHVDDIARVLKDSIDREEIERQLKQYVTEFRLPLSQAKSMLVKKYGGSPNELGLGVFKTIDLLQPNEPSVDLLCRFITVNMKEIEVDSNKKDIAFGIIGDQTATVPYTAWEVGDWKFQRGDVVRVKNAYTKEWKGQPQINFGARTILTPESNDALPAYEAQSFSEPTASSIKNLKSGMRNLSVTARVTSIEKRTVMVEGEEKNVFSGILADETGKTQFSAWHDFGLKKGDAIKVEGAYVKSWRGMPQVGFDERSELTKLKKDALPPLKELLKESVYAIDDLYTMGGTVDAAVQGVILDIREGSGLIFRCPECRRATQKGICRIHGEVEVNPDLRVKAVVDDGSGAVTAIIGTELTEKILGKKVKEAKKIAEEKMDPSVISDELKELLLAKPIQVRGNATLDDFGLTMIVNDLDDIEVDIEKEARALLEETEGY
jgi:replication factor A1